MIITVLIIVNLSINIYTILYYCSTVNPNFESKVLHFLVAAFASSK